MKYVLMYTNRPDLDEAIPAERREAVYGAIYGWFEKYGSVMTDTGAELEGPGTATSVKSGTSGSDPVVVDGPFSEANPGSDGFARPVAESEERAHRADVRPDHDRVRAVGELDVGREVVAVGMAVRDTSL
jgi:hypothetical protein